jgi:hypothetical protein
MLNPNTNPEVPVWPSGSARFNDGVLEVTTGDGIRVAARDITQIGVNPPRAGRLSLLVHTVATAKGLA